MSKLAIHGGSPVRTSPIAPWPHFARDEIEAVQKVLLSGNVNYWTGEEVREFEREFADYLGVRYAVAVMNGSVALELALIALGIGEGDEVIVPSRTFMATASCCVMRGARPVFVDIDRHSQNLIAATIRPAITARTKAIICVHLAGWPCEMGEILELARHHNLFVIEDCAQALGARYHGKSVGTFGHCSAFSFCQDKILTTGGEGGMLVTNDENVYRKAWSYKDHGKDFDVYCRGTEKEYQYSSLGSNWRMTEMQAAIGRVALSKLSTWLEQRNSFAEALNRGMKGIPGVRVEVPPDHIRHAYYKYYIFLQKKSLHHAEDRNRIIEAICAEGIPCGYGSSWAIGQQPAWKKVLLSGTNIDLSPPKFAVDEELGQTSLMLHVHPTLDWQTIEDTIRAVRKVMAHVEGYYAKNQKF